MSIQEKYKDLGKHYLINRYSYTHDGVEYILEDAYRHVIDVYGPGGSDEISHDEELGYKELIGYNGNPSEIDLTWMDPEDTIELWLPTPELRKIYLNSKNAKYTRIFKGQENEGKFYNIDLSINSSFIKAASELKMFLKKNSDSINSLNIRNVPNELFKVWATNMASKSNVEISFYEEVIKQAKRF